MPAGGRDRLPDLPKDEFWSNYEEYCKNLVVEVKALWPGLLEWGDEDIKDALVACRRTFNNLWSRLVVPR